MNYLLGALGFFVALLVSVVLHEGGHFVMARRYGMKATQFFVGFGPTLFSRRRGETEYGFKAIPAGGFVKIVGMTPLEQIEPGDEPRAFYRQSTGRKVVVLAAGSTTHFLIAGVLVLGATFALGAVQEQSPRVGLVAQCVANDPAPGAAASTATGCAAPGSVPAPAVAAGLQAGDLLVAVDGRPVNDVKGFADAVRPAGGKSITITVDRDGTRRDLTVTPALLQRASLTDPAKREAAGAVGVTLQPRQTTERLGFTASVRQSGHTLVLFADGIKTSLSTKLGSITKLYSKDRDPQGFVGVIGAGRISGEVLASDQDGGVKALGLIYLVAGLNLFVGVFNLLPLLPLDGGHIAIAVFEGTRDRLRRMRGYRGERQRVDYNKLLPVTYAVAGAFLVLTVLLVGADIVNPITLG